MELDATTAVNLAAPCCSYEEDVSALLAQQPQGDDEPAVTASSGGGGPVVATTVVQAHPQTTTAADGGGYVCMAMCSQDTLNAMFEAIRDFVQEVTVTFTEDRVTVVNEDTTGGVVVCISMPADKIRASGGLYEYRCSAPRKRACVDVKRLSSVFKAPVRQGDIAELRLLESEPMLMHVIERNVNTRESKATSVRLIDPSADADVGFVDSISYETCVTMESVEFYDSVKKLCTTESTTVRVWCDGASMAMSACGRFIPCITWTMQLRPALDVAREVNEAAAAAEVAAATRVASHGGGGVPRSRSRPSQACAVHTASPPSSASPTSSSSASSSPASPQSPPPPRVPPPPRALTNGDRPGAHTPDGLPRWLVAEDALTVDPSAASSLERRFSCVRPGTAIVCRAKNLNSPSLDAFYPLSFVMRIAKAKAVSRCVALNLSDAVPVICFSYDTEIGSLRFVLASKDESKATDVDREATAAAPKYVPDALSERVDEACRAKCNMAKRKRTRRVWSRKEACAHARMQQQQQQAVAIQTQQQGGAEKRKRPSRSSSSSSSSGSARKRARTDKHRAHHKGPDADAQPVVQLERSPAHNPDMTEADAYAAAMREVAGWTADADAAMATVGGGDASPDLVVVPVPVPPVGV